MGEAKRRGPREQRVAEGIALEAERIRLQRVRERAAEAALTDEQRARRAKARATMATLLAFTAGGSMGGGR